MADKSTLVRDFGVNIAAAAGWTLLVWLASIMRARTGARHPILRTLLLAFASLAFVALNVLIRVRYPLCADGALLISTVVLIGAWWLEVWQFWRLGIIGVGRAAMSNARYEVSLRLCRNSVDFLGIGARKLTDRSAEFESAINRCHRDDRPIRFLLCAPTNTRLVQMARQAGRPASEYQENVRASLRILKHLHEDRARNVEVRFYDELPAFRLMFINDDLCLASHYVFGEGDGSQLPDVYLKRYAGRRDVESIYYGFKRYFDQLWERSRTWDFGSELE